MSENDHPKVIVDDDFLDLRNPQVKTFSRRPTSSQSRTKDSSSTNTQRGAGSPRDVLPGLQRLFNTYNQKNVSAFRSKRGDDGKNPQIDSRFRRKVEEKALSSTRSASVLHEQGKLVKEQQNAHSNSSETTETSVSSSEKKSEVIVPEQPRPKSEGNPSNRFPKKKILSVKISSKEFHQFESDSSVKLEREKRNDNEQNSSRKNERITVEKGPIGDGKVANDENGKLSEDEFSTAVKYSKYDNSMEDENASAEKYRNRKYKKTSAGKSSSTGKREKGKYEKLLEVEKSKNEKLFEMEEAAPKNIKATGKGIIKNIVQECSAVGNKLQQLKWYDPTLLLPNSLHSTACFRKSWTIPSFPLIKREVFWSRHYNVLCEKEDRKTYKFESDDTNSIESVGKSNSPAFRNHYMNLIFCLGCMCGIFLVAGVLTASEIQADIYRPDETKRNVFIHIFRQILYTFGVIIDSFYQVLIFPTTFFKPKVKSSKSWTIF